ncbi:MAG: serine hydrolase, partial [Anaerolineae bacterium]|nr:serine hydrolase [Anaerolineae bacterium]
MDSISPKEVGLSPARLKRIHTHMQRQVDQQKYAGILSVVARHSQVAYSDCVGMMDREARKPVQFDTIFRI